MINLIHADLYRLLNKKSNYVFLLFSSLAFTLVMLFGKLSNVNQEQVFSPSLFNMALNSSLFVSVIFISTNVLISVYCDDVSSGHINHIYSNTVSKTQYVFAKFISLTIYVLSNYIFFGLVFFIVFFIFSEGFYSDINPYLQYIYDGFTFAVTCYLSILVYTLLGSVVLYTTSKPIEAIIAVILFSSNIILQLYDLISTIIKPLNLFKPFLYDYILREFFSNSNAATKIMLSAIAYIILFLIFNIFYLNSRELKTE